jgi:tripartite-type tricarboxylate transporter receptor subunit TctC
MPIWWPALFDYRVSREDAWCFLPMRHFYKRILITARAAIAIGIGMVAFTSANAQENYASRPIRLVVPFSAGGINDVLGRAWAQKVAPHLGTIFIENRGGGGGSVGATEVARAAPDGYSLLLGNTSTQVISPQLTNAPTYDPARDFAAVYIIAQIPTAIAVHPSLPVNSITDLIAYAKTSPGTLSYGSAGVGSMTHLAGELFKQFAGKLDMVHVPYRGAAPGLTDLISGQVPIFSASMSGQLLELHRAGKIRIVSINAPERIAIAPDIPTAVEHGISGMVVQIFNGIFAHKVTPKPIIDRIAQATAIVMEDHDFQGVLIKSGAELVRKSDPASAQELVSREGERWKPVISALGIKIEQ